MLLTAMRGAAVTVGGLALEVGLWHVTSPVVSRGFTAATTPGSADTDAVADVVTAAAATVLLGAWTWLTVAALLISADVLRGATRPRSRLAVPQRWHRMVTGLLGVGLACAPVAAGADTRSDDPARDRIAPPAQLIHGLPLPDRPVGIRPPPPAHRVVAGDSLWSVAHDHLGRAATDGRVAAAWPRWYAANADVIGTDPDLITPGTLLRAPGHRDNDGGHP